MIEHLSLGCICLPWVNPSINLWARWCVSHRQNMPCGLDGLDLAHAIRSAFPEIPILVVSSAAATDRDRMDHGYAFLKKPFELKLLAQTVHQLLTQRPESVSPR
jgi:DNA-binding NtrC family response regulator